MELPFLGRAAVASAAASALACRRGPAGPPEAGGGSPAIRPPAAPSPHWLPTAHGLVLEPLASGHGQSHPAATDRVRLWLRGWGQGNVPFVDATEPRAPLLVAVGETFPGLAEALQLMLEGMRARVWVPAGLAGPGQPAHPSGPLVLEIELLQVLRGASAPAGARSFRASG